MCSRHEWFMYLVPLQTPINVILCGESTIPATGVGRVLARMHAKGERTHTVFQNVLSIPELHENLVFVPHLADCGAEVRSKRQCCNVYNQCGHLTCEGQHRRTLHIIDIRWRCGQFRDVGLLLEVPFPETAHIASVYSFPNKGDDARTMHLRVD